MTFLQFLMTRHDNKKGRHKCLIDAIEMLKNDIRKLREEAEVERAMQARIRILGFSDEVRRQVRHSKEAFDQVNLDIDAYRTYCDTHQDYKNNRADMAIANIERVYSICLKENDFLL